MKTVTIYVDGVFDLFHFGHVNMFIQALNLTKKEYGECEIFLIAGVVIDKDVESYKRTPILTFFERVNIVSSCKYVNKVIPAVLYLTNEFIDSNNIDLVFHGNDSEQAEFFKIAIDRGIMRYLQYTNGISTTDIINRCIKK